MKKTIMVIDDDTANLVMMKLLLAKLGHDTITFDNGWDGLAAIREKMPDLVILDLMMTPIDGWQVLDELKRDGLEGVPVILFTAKYVSEKEIKPYRDSIICHLPKPVTFPELKQVLDTYLSDRVISSR
ncbi:response regulator [Methanocalculus chunghsingensis]|nr:response regulator [Methanocalculus chunghsingensis]